MTTDYEKEDGHTVALSSGGDGNERKQSKKVAFNEQSNAVASALSILVRSMICFGTLFAVLCTNNDVK